MAESYYTPFMSNIGAVLGQGLKAQGLREQEAERNKLIQRAYMGQPGAMEQLYAVDPQAASQVETQQRQKEQAALQNERTQAQIDAEKRKIVAENSELVTKTLKEASKFDTVEEAQSYIDNVISINKDLFKGIVFDPITPEFFDQIKTSYAGTTDKRVQSSKQLPGGFVQLVYSDGSVELSEPKEAESELIKKAEERGAELQGLRSAERKSGEESIKAAVEAFKQLTPIRKNIANLDEGIRLINEGAETGVVASKLPSVKAASIKLDNLQGQLGLDVIGNTTFGALSESELAFALDTSLPTKLEGPELKKWLVEKRDAQAKLVDYLNDAAIFLGTPGNSIADYLQQQKDKQREQEEAGETNQTDEGAVEEPPLTAEEQAELEQLRQRFNR